MAHRPALAWRRWSTSSTCRCRIPRSTGCCSCTRSKWRTIRARCCAKSGGCWRRAGGCSRWCRTGAACGRAWTRRRSATAGPIRARRSISCCATPGSRRSAGARRSMCRRSRAAGSCARRWPGSAPARRSRRRLPACTSSKRPSRSIAPFRRRRGANASAWCPRSSRCWPLAGRRLSATRHAAWHRRHRRPCPARRPCRGAAGRDAGAAGDAAGIGRAGCRGRSG